jgi:hypothetical protein
MKEYEVRSIEAPLDAVRKYHTVKAFEGRGMRLHDCGNVGSEIPGCHAILLVTDVSKELVSLNFQVEILVTTYKSTGRRNVEITIAIKNLLLFYQTFCSNFQNKSDILLFAIAYMWIGILTFLLAIGSAQAELSF